MSTNSFALLRNKLNYYFSCARKIYLKLHGLTIGKGSQIGKGFINWPNKLTIGNSCVIEDGVFFKFAQPFNEENKLIIGNSVFIGNGCQFNCRDTITVGDNCLIAGNTCIIDTGHEFKVGVLINKQPVTTAPITIEQDVWIGAGCKILAGVTIGAGSIIGAGSVVNKSVPPNQIWAGVPARYIRNRD